MYGEVATGLPSQTGGLGGPRDDLTLISLWMSSPDCIQWSHSSLSVSQRNVRMLTYILCTQGHGYSYRV